MTTVELPRYQHVIDGRRVEAASGQRYDSVDPYLGAPWASAADGDAADVDLAVAAARRALGEHTESVLAEFLPGRTA